MCGLISTVRLFLFATAKEGQMLDSIPPSKANTRWAGDRRHMVPCGKKSFGGNIAQYTLTKLVVRIVNGRGYKRIATSPTPLA
jgi:hypothetical protein